MSVIKEIQLNMFFEFWKLFIVACIATSSLDIIAKALNLIEITELDDSTTNNQSSFFNQVHADPPQANLTSAPIPEDAQFRRYWLREASSGVMRSVDTDNSLKDKIATLVKQTQYDTERKLKILASVKEKHKNDAPYKIGFILSLIKKSRDVLNELFNVAVKHRDQWKALEELKIFELVMHTSVDTTNLVRQLMELHIQRLNTTTTPGHKLVYYRRFLKDLEG